MKVYEAVFDENNSEGVYALSVVENPAMEDFWITLKEHPKEIDLTLANEDKRLLLGAALIPDKKVYRNVGGNEFYLTMSGETIEKMAHSFMKKGYQNNSSLEHQTKLSGMSVVETWIVKDSQNDKSNAYGKQYPEGTWVAMMKVDNDQVWQKAKNGEIKGFSIDAFIGLQEINLKSSIKMADNKTITEAIVEGFKTFFNSNNVEDVKKEEVEAAETESEAVTEEVQSEEEAFDVDAFKKDLEDIFANFSKTIDAKIENVKTEFSKDITEKEKEIDELKTELSKQPESKPIKSAPVEHDVKLTANGNLLELIRKNKN